jgi:hypothetical protein
MAQVAQSCRIYRPRDQSSSADTFIKQPGFILEIQDKSGVGGGLDFAIVNEVGKSARSSDVVLLFVAIRLSPTLDGLVKDRVLTLKPGISSEGAGFLFYRESCDSTEWTHTVVDGQLKVKVGSSPKGRGPERPE